jgi:hypothetical protein
MDEKTTYYYIDESGHINNNSNFFIHGCLKTDTPSDSEKVLLSLKEEIHDSLVYESFHEDFKKKGFHAVDNHPDIRSLLYKVLFKMNFRCYFVVIDKRDPSFQILQSKKGMDEIFLLSIRKLLTDRIKKNKEDKNIFYFEEIEIKERSLKSVLDEFFKTVDTSIKCEYYIVGKETENLALIDYANYSISSILKDITKANRSDILKKNARMVDYFKLLLPKTGCVYLLNEDIYLSRLNGLSVESILDNLTGLKG